MTSAERTKLSGIEAGAQVNKVTSVVGKTGAVTLTKSDVGLSNVNNTSDLDKPISTATQTALDGKVDNSRVLTDVPLGAKFTDTIYTHPSTHPASMITESTTKRFVSDTEKAAWNAKETTTGAQTKADTAEANAKAYAGSIIPTKLSQLENDPQFVTQAELGQAGYGDMMKSIYDTNADGKVDIAETAESVPWAGVTGKPTTFTPSSHAHDDRYYTETEVDTKLSAKQNSLGFTPENVAKKGVANGYASLGADGKVPTTQLPSMGTQIVVSATEPTGLQEGDWWFREV